MPKAKELTGQRFGRLMVIERDGKTNHGAAKWLCLCDCGKTTSAIGSELLKGSTRSCGCLAREVASSRMAGIPAKNKTHGMAGTPLYKVWVQMKRRCYNKKDVSFPLYGGRGIAVCDEWRNSFSAFYEWAVANGYETGLSIDRQQNNKGYSPDNCQWTSDKKQCNNRRSNRSFSYEGKTQTIAEWAAEYGINYKKLYKRLTSGWEIERALKTP